MLPRPRPQTSLLHGPTGPLEWPCECVQTQTPGSPRTDSPFRSPSSPTQQMGPVFATVQAKRPCVPAVFPSHPHPAVSQPPFQTHPEPTVRYSAASPPAQAPGLSHTHRGRSQRRPPLLWPSGRTPHQLAGKVSTHGALEASLTRPSLTSPTPSTPAAHGVSGLTAPPRSPAQPCSEALAGCSCSRNALPEACPGRRKGPVLGGASGALTATWSTAHSLLPLPPPGQPRVHLHGQGPSLSLGAGAKFVGFTHERVV